MQPHSYPPAEARRRASQVLRGRSNTNRGEADTRGVEELSYMRKLFVHRIRSRSRPDAYRHDNRLRPAEYVGTLTAYLGSDRVPTFVQRLFSKFKRFTHFGSIPANTYAPTARTADGSLVIVYL